MPVLTQTFTNFNRGVHTDEDLSLEGYVRRIEGVDIHGTGAGTATNAPHLPGVYMPSQEMALETEGTTSAGNEVSAALEWIVPFNALTWGITNNGNLIVNTTSPASDSTGTWYRVSATSSTTGGGGLLPFGANLYYGQDALLGKTDGTTPNTQDNFATFAEDSTTPRPMAIFGGKLHIANGRFIATVDSDETTFTDQALTLPVGFVIRSMVVWNDQLAISADFTPSGSSESTQSKLFTWDGTSATFINSLELPYTDAPLVYSHDNFLWIFGDDGALNGIINTFNGSQLEKVFFLPDTVFHGNGGITRFQANMLVTVDGRTTNDNGGILTVGRGGVEKPYGVSNSHLAGEDGAYNVSATNYHAIYAESNNILTSTFDGTKYERWKSDNNDFPDSGTLVQTLPLHFNLPTIRKTFLSIRPDLESAGTTTGSTFQILYRTDLSGSFVSLKTINASDSDLNPLIPLRGVRGKRIEFQFQWVTTTNAPLRLRSFTVLYSPLGKSR